MKIDALRYLYVVYKYWTGAQIEKLSDARILKNNAFGMAMTDEGLPKASMEWIPLEQRKWQRPRKKWTGKIKRATSNRPKKRKSLWKKSGKQLISLTDVADYNMTIVFDSVSLF